MYYSYIVPIPQIQGKIRIKQSTYVELETGRKYVPKTKHSQPSRVAIGKVDPDHEGYMFPNETYYKVIPDPIYPEVASQSRSHCLRVGAYLLIQRIIKNLGLEKMIENCNFKQEGLIFDLAAYLIVEQDNAGQYYPDYAFNHPLFSHNMHMYSDSTVSDFFRQMTDDQRLEFLKAWNENREHNNRIYISYDSTNRNCQAGEVSFAELGHAKDDQKKPIVNMSIAYDTNNRMPLLYEDYPGSITDVSQLQYLADKMSGYGYTNIGIIIDRGYFSKKNLTYLDSKGIPFIIMVKGVRDVVEKAMDEVRGTFETDRKCRNNAYRVYGATVQQKLYETDKKDRYFHIFYSDTRGAAEREKIESKVLNARKKLEKMIGKKMIFQEPEAEKEGDHKGDSANTPESEAEKRAKEIRIQEEKQEIEKNRTALNRITDAHYFDLVFDRHGVLSAIIDKNDVIDNEKKSCGYFSIVSAENMSAIEALALYKGRDPSEKLFCADKSFLGDHASRIYSDESEQGKTFVQFLALIIRQKIYTCLHDENLKQTSPLNYLNVPAAMKELEKIEMTQLPDGNYRLNWAVTATQKKILAAFQMTEADIKNGAKQIAEFINQSAPK